MKVVRVTYDVMEPVLDMRTALDHPTVIHPEDDLHYNMPVGGDPKRNLACSYSRVVGDIEGELAKCDYVVEDTYFDQPHCRRRWKHSVPSVRLISLVV